MARHTTGDPDVAHDDSLRRYELSLDGEVVGVAEYVDRDGTRAFVHTEIVPELRSGGLAARLVHAALVDARSAGRRPVPVCAYVVAYARRHPELFDSLGPAAPEGEGASPDPSE